MYLPLVHFDSLQSSWKWFIYNRTQNINRKSSDDTSPPRKKKKLATAARHQYPPVPNSADDETSSQVNIELLQKEWDKPKKWGSIKSESVIYSYSSTKKSRSSK